MTSEFRLAQIVTALERVELRCLVMGGHAVRYYGLARNTIDFDLHLAPDGWDLLTSRLVASGLFAQAPIEGPSWRPDSFRRFQVGRLEDGREEWLEFWRTNHLLRTFDELATRHEDGEYGGRRLPFLGLPDLIRSKETERAVDWDDIAVLEEFLDARRIAAAEADTGQRHRAMSGLRSRRGFERILQLGWFADVAVVGQSLAETDLSITQAFLLPFGTSAPAIPTTTVAIEPVILTRLPKVAPGSALHLTLVEAVRRQYRTAMQARDRADKEAIRAAQQRDR